MSHRFPSIPRMRSRSASSTEPSRASQLYTAAPSCVSPFQMPSAAARFSRPSIGTRRPPRTRASALSCSRPAIRSQVSRNSRRPRQHWLRRNLPCMASCSRAKRSPCLPASGGHVQPSKAARATGSRFRRPSGIGPTWRSSSCEAMVFSLSFSTKAKAAIALPSFAMASSKPACSLPKLLRRCRVGNG